MKIHIISPQKFNPRTLEFYRTFAEEVSFDEAEVIVTQLDEVKTDREVIVATNCTGLDHIKAPNAKIFSLRGEDLSTFTAVSELVLWAILEMIRKRANQELRGKTLSIIGDGRIGQHVRLRSESFGIRVLSFDKGEPMENLKDILKESDIVILSITADEENRNFMDRGKFEMMKDGAWFLNSARPWLVEENALKWALESGKIKGAWSDFRVNFSHPNLLITDHRGGSTSYSLERSQLLIAKRVKQYAKRSI